MLHCASFKMNSFFFVRFKQNTDPSVFNPEGAAFCTASWWLLCEVGAPSGGRAAVVQQSLSGHSASEGRCQSSHSDAQRGRMFLATEFCRKKSFQEGLGRKYLEYGAEVWGFQHRRDVQQSQSKLEGQLGDGCPHCINVLAHSAEVWAQQICQLILQFILTSSCL